MCSCLLDLSPGLRPKPTLRGLKNPVETLFVIKNLGHHNERAAQCFPRGFITIAPSKQDITHAYLMCFPSIYTSLLLKSLPEILRKRERNSPSKCVIFSSNRMSAHFLKDPFPNSSLVQTDFSKLDYPHHN